MTDVMSDIQKMDKDKMPDDVKKKVESLGLQFDAALNSLGIGAKVEDVNALYVKMVTDVQAQMDLWKDKNLV